MKYDVKDEAKCKKVIDVVVDEETVNKSRVKIIEEFKKNAQVDGYRKGKVPEDIVKQMYKDKINEELLKEVVQTSYTEVMKELDLHIVTYPQIDKVGVEGEEVKYTIIAEVNPVFDIKDYSKVKIKAKKLKEVSKDDVEREIKKLRQYRGNLKDSLKDVVGKEDYIEASIVGVVDNVTQEDLTADNQVLQLGSKSVLKEMEDGIVGMKVGEEKDINAVFPEDYFNKKYAGKKAIFKVKVKKIKELELPELNDEFVKSLGGHESVDALKSAIENELKKQAEAEVRSYNVNEIFKKLLEDNKFEVPEGMIVSEANNIMNRYEQNLQQQGLTMAQLGVTKKDLFERNKGQAEENIKIMYLLRKIGEKENIELSDADVETEIRKVADEMKQDADTMIKQSKAQGNWEALKAKLLEDKVVNKLLETVVK